MRNRLDIVLVERGLAPSRSRARDLIKGGKVLVDGEVCMKAGAEVDADEALSLREAGPPAVSRGGSQARLRAGELRIRSRGPGGARRRRFDWRLHRGSARRAARRKVYAVDVGHGQLHAQPASRSARRLARGLRRAHAHARHRYPSRSTAIVADVSFISLTKALGPALALAAPGAWLVALIKPQFEVGRERVGKGGIVRDAAARAAARRSRDRVARARRPLAHCRRRSLSDKRRVGQRGVPARRAHDG